VQNLHHLYAINAVFLLLTTKSKLLQNTDINTARKLSTIKSSASIFTLSQEGCKILWWVCLVCLLAYLRNHTTKLNQIVCACCLWPWPGPLWQHCNKLCDDVLFTHNGFYGASFHC